MPRPWFFPAASRLGRTSARVFVPALATPRKTRRPPGCTSTLPTRTSRCRPPSAQVPMNVESRVTTIADAGASDRTARTHPPPRQPPSHGGARSRGAFPCRPGTSAPIPQRRAGRSSCRRDAPAASPTPMSAGSAVAPANASLDPATQGTARPGQPHRLTWPNRVATAWSRRSFTRQAPSQREQSGRRTACSLACAATISR